MWTTLNFRGRGKTKKGSRYLQEDPRYRIWKRSVDWFRLYDRRWIDRQTDSKIIKKSKYNFLTIAVLPSLLMSLESKNDTLWENAIKIFLIFKTVSGHIFESNNLILIMTRRQYPTAHSKVSLEFLHWKIQIKRNVRLVPLVHI